MVQSAKEVEKSLLRFLYLKTRLVLVRTLKPGMCEGSIFVLAYCNKPSAVVFCHSQSNDSIGRAGELTLGLYMKIRRRYLGSS